MNKEIGLLISAYEKKIDQMGDVLKNGDLDSKRYHFVEGKKEALEDVVKDLRAIIAAPEIGQQQQKLELRMKDGVVYFNDGRSISFGVAELEGFKPLRHDCLECEGKDTLEQVDGSWVCWSCKATCDSIDKKGLGIATI